MNEKIVLLIEDNPDDEQLTLRALRKNNVMNEVVVACDGEEALEYLFGTGKFDGRNVQSQPALILLDMGLPKISGSQVLQIIRSDARTRHIPVVVLSSSDMPETVKQAYELGANSYICKPVNHNEFSEMVLNVSMYWLLLNEPPVPQPA